MVIVSRVTTKAENPLALALLMIDRATSLVLGLRSMLIFEVRNRVGVKITSIIGTNDVHLRFLWQHSRDCEKTQYS